MDLPASAAGMMKNWWSFAYHAGTDTNPDGSYVYTLPLTHQIASIVNRVDYGGQGGYNPPGLSVLFSKARAIGNATRALAAAAGSDPVTADMVAEAPWSRTLAEQAALPKWQARVSMTYTDPAGVELEGTAVVIIDQVLPRDVDALYRQVSERLQDQLASPPGQGTPRQGQLTGIASVTLLAV